MDISRRTGLLCIVLYTFLFVYHHTVVAQQSLRFSFADHDLTDRQAAAHLLDRFAFGPRPGEVDSVVRVGLERWFEAQLTGRLSDDDLNERLASFPALAQSSEEIIRTYPNAGYILQSAYQEGILDRGDTTDRNAMSEKLRKFREENGFLPVQELTGQLLAQKALRATTSMNQLREVLTDFWFNHFNVSLTDNQTRVHVLSYERDAIRPHALGRFVDLLKATAKHPAMLTYLDNAQSTAGDSALTTVDLEMRGMDEEQGMGGMPIGSMSRRARMQNAERQKRATDQQPEPARRRGINENYARELMELHTLGVDGGYTQDDVVEVARAFTGWTIVPPGERGKQLKRRIGQGRAMGSSTEGGFLFRAEAHDAGSKVILGRTFPAGGGREEGELVLEMLARHPSTAKFISRAIAIRFVSDDPPQSLVDRMARSFSTSRGDIISVMKTLVASPEFWSAQSRRAKIKSPFELAVSAVRALDAQVETTRGIVGWTARMGQPLYAFQAPTGYPDRGTQWINSGSLMNRMNFGLQLASGRVQGVKVDLDMLTDGREPGSPDEALVAYANALLPERNIDSTIVVLSKIIRATGLRSQLETKAGQAVGEENEEDMGMEGEDPSPLMKKETLKRKRETMEAMRPPTMPEHIVGLILGSPEFQRR